MSGEIITDSTLLPSEGQQERLARDRTDKEY